MSQRTHCLRSVVPLAMFTIVNGIKIEYAEKCLRLAQLVQNSTNIFTSFTAFIIFFQAIFNVTLIILGPTRYS